MDSVHPVEVHYGEGEHGRRARTAVSQGSQFGRFNEAMPSYTMFHNSGVL